MKRIILLVLISCATNCFGQIGSLSGTKVNSVSYNVLPLHTLEFEPTFSTLRYNSVFATTPGEEEELGFEQQESSLSWRMTYGAFENTEFGFAVPSDFSSVEFAMKYTLLDSTWLNLGAMLGYNQELGNTRLPTGIGLDKAFQLGLIGSFDIDSKHSIDLNLQFEKSYFSRNLDSSKWIVTADFGSYALHENYQLVLGACYFDSFQGESQNHLTISPGLSIETSDRFGLLFFLSDVVYGTEEYPNSLAFTFIVTTVFE